MHDRETEDEALRKIATPCPSHRHAPKDVVWNVSAGVRFVICGECRAVLLRLESVARA